MRNIARVLLIAVTSLLLNLAITLAAYPEIQPSTPVAAYSADAEIASALYASSATQEAAQRIADARLREQMREIDGLRSEVARLKSAGAEHRDAADAARLDLARAEERFVAELAERDRAYAQGIAVFRGAVEDIASTPEGLEALAMFNAGDEIGALAILDGLAAARAKARQVRADIETAADLRQNAILALEARSRGVVSTQQAIARYKEIVSLDSSMPWDWLRLSDLYLAAGDLAAAEASSTTAVNISTADRDKSIALKMAGDILIAQGKVELGLRSLVRSHELTRASFSGENADRLEKLDFARSLLSMGRIYFSSAEVHKAEAPFKEAAQLAEEVLLINPNDEQAGEILAAANLELGRSLRINSNSASEITILQALKTAEKFSLSHPSSSHFKLIRCTALRELITFPASKGRSNSNEFDYEDCIIQYKRAVDQDPENLELRLALLSLLTGKAEEKSQQGRYLMALADFEDALIFSRNIERAHASNFLWQGLHMKLLGAFGNASLSAAKPERAILHFEEYARIAHQMYDRDPSSTAVQRAVMLSYELIGDARLNLNQAEDALEAYSKGLLVSRKLKEQYPNNLTVAEDVAWSLQSVGQTSLTLGHQSDAARAFSERIIILQGLVAADPTNRNLQLDLILAHLDLAAIEGNGTHGFRALALAEEMRTKGLAPSDYDLVDEVRREIQRIENKTD